MERSTIGKLGWAGSRKGRGLELQRSKTLIYVELTDCSEVHVSVVFDKRPHDQVFQKRVYF